jgi:hypothetical protein
MTIPHRNRRAIANVAIARRGRRSAPPGSRHDPQDHLGPRYDSVVRFRALFVLLACAACTSLSDLSGGGGPDGGDGGGAPPPPPPQPPSPADGSPGDAGDAGTDATSGATNLVTNPGFESAGGGCGAGWTSYGATLTLSTTAHSGSSSCQVCAIDPDAGASMQITSTTLTNVKAGAMYSTEAWLRTVPGQPTTGIAGAQIYVDEIGGGQQYYQASSPTPSATWTPSNGAFTVQADGTLKFDVHVYYPMGGCVLIDDVGVYTAN